MISKRTSSAAIIETQSIEEHFEQITAATHRQMESLLILVRRLKEETETIIEEGRPEFVKELKVFNLAYQAIELRLRAMEGDLINAEPASHSVN